MALITTLINNPVFTLLRRTQLVLAVTIYVTLMLMNSPQLGSAGFSDKALHLLGNFLLFASIWTAFADRFRLWQILLVAGVFSLLAELAQSLTQTRTTDLLDVFANLSGILIAYLALAAITSVYRYQQRLT